MHVVIIGGGIGGLTAAAAISGFCDSVTVVEKDTPPSVDHPRRYAPQGAHIHILLQAGLNMLEALLPGIQQELIDGGSSQINAGTGQQIFEYGAWRPERSLNMTYLGQSRLLLENTLYKRVKGMANVKFITGKVSCLCLSESKRAITGVSINGGEMLSADLVVDASGVGGVFSKWLRKNDIVSIEEDSFPIHIFYSTVHFKKPQQYLSVDENILIVPEAGVSNIGGSLLDIENDTWCVSLHGRDGEAVPTTMSEWRSAIRNLPDPRIWSRVEAATAISSLTHFRKRQAIWRRFDKCKSLPSGYIPIGDAINSLNPIFGQGMTVAIGHATALRDAGRLHGFDSDRFGPEYFGAAMAWTQRVWRQSAAFDKNFFSETSKDKKRIELVRKFTAVQHKKMKESEAFHLQQVSTAQMLS